MPFSGATHTINTHTRHHIVKISVVNCSPEAGLLLLHVGTVLVNTKHNFSCVKKTISYQLPKKEKKKTNYQKCTGVSAKTQTTSSGL